MQNTFIIYKVGFVIASLKPGFSCNGSWPLLASLISSLEELYCLWLKPQDNKVAHKLCNVVFKTDSLTLNLGKHLVGNANFCQFPWTKQP